ncbi:hypothetical protein K438DRAFT_1833495 [Mycena galopus ATCC 62051]|nr:hypothetical protein K438DRAFT_1833495 [Mycena galopus ATCC 62051]
MCWPRNFCCRCSRSSSWVVRPPYLTFGRTPRRPEVPQALFPAFPSWTPPTNFLPPLPAPPPFIPTRRPGRRVRFVDDDPPPLVPAPCVPAPFMLPSPAPCMSTPCMMMAQSPPCWHQQLHPELCSPRGCPPFLTWDITQFASSARLQESAFSPAVNLPAFTSPAIHPSAQLLTISYADTPVLLQWERLWGPIFARAQGMARCVTLEDVLDAIHAYFAQPLTPADRACMGAHTWGVVSDAYYRRLPKSPNLRAYDVSRGPLRVDVLNGATKFGGMVGAGHAHLRLMLCQ